MGKHRSFSVLAALLLAAAVCGGCKEEQLSKEAVFSPNKALALGRTAYHEDRDTLWCSLSGSGIAFRFYGDSCEIELVADTAWESDKYAARYAVYADGIRILDKRLDKKNDSIDIDNPNTREEGCEVRLIKLSEALSSSVGIGDITVHDPLKSAFKPLQRREHYIEFVGDSLTCGYGVDGVNGVDEPSAGNEDATKACAYKTAQILGTDYSLVCYSGYGIVSGHTSGAIRDWSLVPDYYTLCGHCDEILPGGTYIDNDKWDFIRQPDVVVVDLGSNDSSYTRYDLEKQTAFTDKYISFLKLIRLRNPKARIICAYGLDDITLGGAIGRTVKGYKEETGDELVTAFQFDKQLEEDGLSCNYHPTAVTYDKAAKKLSLYIKELMNW